MKALLYKDAMVLWKQMKLMLLLILIFAVIPSEFQNTFAVLYAALLPYSALAYDERSRWDRMAAAMPYSARDIVTEKYVFGWIAALGTLALTLVLRLVSQYLLHLGEGASAEMLLIAFFGSLIAMAVTLPMMFRFGVEKGRLAMLLLIGLICGGAAGPSLWAPFRTFPCCCWRRPWPLPSTLCPSPSPSAATPPERNGNDQYLRQNYHYTDGMPRFSAESRGILLAKGRPVVVE